MKPGPVFSLPVFSLPVSCTVTASEGTELTRTEITSGSLERVALSQRSEVGCRSFPYPESSDPHFLVSVSLWLSFAGFLVSSITFFSVASSHLLSFLFGVSNFCARLGTPPCFSGAPPPYFLGPSPFGIFAYSSEELRLGEASGAPPTSNVG